ncbi:c-type cytochrome biogenesis protein CcsB [uncultured Tessaracoccus sp.]|uniref:c-type cytochrome biogenesis protein CcsB n=1 Tax=uncultured Tessaracoccus sp. TaxID=905023 RepID=UPI0025EFD17D|nr:c-type cytochrome biogenesis protein CcsB [uncultured Tessaracoccus sp.]
MLETAQLLLVATTALVLVAFACYAVAFWFVHQRAEVRERDAVAVGAPRPAGPQGAAPPSGSEARRGRDRGVVWLGSTLVKVGLVLLTVSLVTRAMATGHAPFANHYEFAVSFGWGMILAHVLVEWRYRVRTLGLVILPVIFGMLVYATTLSYEAKPLMPALQNSPLLTIHVFCAALSYGAAVIGFGAAVMYLLAPHVPWKGWPKQELLDELGYKAVVATFPLLTIMIVLGSIWANVAWGRYWSWDPKETAALVTWLVYGSYLHARVTRGWRGSRSAWLLVLGFVAILFTYFGNLFFGGLHSYA